MKNLTASEYSILEYLSKGYLYKEIANEKKIGIDTVKKHCYNLYRKIQVRNKVEAINWLQQNHISSTKVELTEE
jgi:NarL family two-component system response regulator LiaR